MAASFFATEVKQIMQDGSVFHVQFINDLSSEIAVVTMTQNQLKVLDFVVAQAIEDAKEAVIVKLHNQNNS
ncbi:MAG: hypothetical protein AAGJ29_12320 [Pseudomonadota bacterium]